MKISQEQWSLKPEQYGPFWKYIEAPDITDINFDGQWIWVDDLKKGTYRVPDEVSQGFLKQFAQRISNLVSITFNKYNPLLEAETQTLRISIIHEEVTNTGMSISIRKTPAVQRLNYKKLIGEGYCSPPILNFLQNCIKGHLNTVIAGLPGTGKTELLKYLTQFIPPNEKVITIEDNLEIHLRQIKPLQDCVELKVDNGAGTEQEGTFTYTDAIKTCLRQNPKWILLSEARSEEVKFLIESFSTGLHGITTIHTDALQKIPDRIENMASDPLTASRLKNDVFTFLDLGILIRKKSSGKGIFRYIDQVCFFDRDVQTGENQVKMLVDEGKIIDRSLPVNIKKKIREFTGLTDLFEEMGTEGEHGKTD